MKSKANLRHLISEIIMAIEIDGVSYFSPTDLITELGVSRQTLWRWRQEGKIPAGNRFRNRMVLFTTLEAETIRDYANRIEPIMV